MYKLGEDGSSFIVRLKWWRDVVYGFLFSFHFSFCLVCLSVTEVSTFLFSVDMPDHIVGETDHLVPGSFSHLGESLRLCLVLESVGWEVYTYTQFG